jgi:hypothetical protein
VQASLEQKQRLQRLFFGDGIAFDGKAFVGTAPTAHAFRYLAPSDDVKNHVASPMTASWNQIATWLRQIDTLRQAA